VPIYVRELQWDEWNVAHIALHDVTPDEVEDVCRRSPVTSETYEDRIRAIGPTTGDRMLTVILAPKGLGVYYPVTARPASRKERRVYQELRGGESQ
jgi:uncharacterized DUF497 family protein